MRKQITSLTRIPTSDTSISLHVAGNLADEVARRHVLSSYLERRATETVERQHWDIQAFATYLTEAQIETTGIALDLLDWQHQQIKPLLSLEAWGQMTDGLVEGFVRWQLARGYAIGSINVRLSTIKTYCSLACRAGFLSPDMLARIKLVTGFRHQEGVNVDATRNIKRIGTKKEREIVLTKEQVRQLKDQPDTLQGWRDRVLLCFFLDHGLRCGELAMLTRADIDLTSGKFHVYRQKVDKHQYHKMSDDTLLAVINYLQRVSLKPKERLLRGSQKSRTGNRLQGCMSQRAVTARMNVLGKQIGIDHLSAHDGRHTWATAAARAKTDVKTLADAGGWASITTPYNRYVKANAIANEGVKLDY